MPVAEGFLLHLDGKPFKTLKGREFMLPTQALAEAIVAEWNAQGEKILPDTMPFTRYATIALDVVADDRALIEKDLFGFCETDQLYFRETEDVKLLQRQKLELDPIIEWAEATCKIKILPSYGVMVTPQDVNCLNILQEKISALTDMQLSAFAIIVNSTASVVLALALLNEFITFDKAAKLSQLDEIYQSEKWGVDEEAEISRLAKAKEIESATIFLHLLQSKN